ncbi:hypothetical protein E5676_scaffold392G00980 [Cucumis melo var. makuwa]|uniref:Reverse transcriptase n=1 Tax=Cucumis melo var. makuwa TaxID=1194695 RepID=A0A5D3DC85_CUCMM|nr:hypothetical protein E6C27_scaffold238G001840 [Cucumis melo var. makuwa]TYK21118.1 hypothetical protein E5676_scaffold392G00980 [Cucumis melo var. makuwa]
MPSIIAPTQSTFIEGRQTMDPIFIANEVVEDYRAKKKKGWILNPRYSVFINGQPRGRILASRGIRQGDPLSPCLFLLVSEVPSALVEKLHFNGHFEGFVVGKEKIRVSIVQFAVNWEKSALCGVNVDEIELMSTASSLGCKADHLPLFYLGGQWQIVGTAPWLLGPSLFGKIMVFDGKWGPLSKVSLAHYPLLPDGQVAILGAMEI